MSFTESAWDKPIVTISSNRNSHYYSNEVMVEQAKALGECFV